MLLGHLNSTNDNDGPYALQLRRGRSENARDAFPASCSALSLLISRALRLADFNTLDFLTTMLKTQAIGAYTFERTSNKH